MAGDIHVAHMLANVPLSAPTADSLLPTQIVSPIISCNQTLMRPMGAKDGHSRASASPAFFVLNAIELYTVAALGLIVINADNRIKPNNNSNNK